MVTGNRAKPSVRRAARVVRCPVIPAQVQEAASFFGGLSAPEQVRFLVRLGWELTILGRGTYEVGGEGIAEPSRLRTIHESEHRLLGHLRELLEGSPHRRPNDVLMGVLLDHADVSVREGAMSAYNGAVDAFRRDS
jgi:hypothetical protein